MEPTGEAGFAAIVVLSLAGVLLACGSFTVALGSIAVSRHRAAAAADLAVLSAALHRFEGESAACGAARRTAEAQGARVETCHLAGPDVVVMVAVVPVGALARLGTARATARAGPDRGVRG